MVTPLVWIRLCHVDSSHALFQFSTLKNMKKLYYINILIYNDMGELVDTRLASDSLDELRLATEANVDKWFNQAEEFAKEEGMYLEELYDSKDEVEFDKEDII